MLPEVDHEQHLIMAGLGLRFVRDRPLADFDAPVGQDSFESRFLA